MKKLWITFLLLASLPVLALADAVPAPVRAMLEEYHGGLMQTDYIGFTLPDGREVGFAITGGYSLEGVETAGDGWQYTLMTHVMTEMRPAHFERPAGTEPAFAIVSEDGRSRLEYRFDGEEFRLAGWRFPDAPPVGIAGDLLRYDLGTHTEEVVLPGGATQHPWQMEELPLTPERARELAAITQENVADLYPGYTLRGYAAYNTGTAADAAYSRVTDGQLHIRRVGFLAGGTARVTDCLPVPLSEGLLRRLQTEPFETLICCMAGSGTFLTQDAFDRERLALSADAVLLDSEVQEKSVIALAEEDGVRRLYVWERGAEGYAARRTLPLPQDASADLFHAGDGEVQLEWNGQGSEACFRRAADGSWLLQWLSDYSASGDRHLSACAFGVWEYGPDGEEILRVGTLAGRSLFEADLTTLTAGEVRLDRTGWAVVNNPNPADRLHLRTEPTRSSRSQGKLYNGTPLLVLGSRGGWTKVQLGLGSSARVGWMMTEYLAFGDDMDRVKAVWPQLCFREEYEASNRLDGGFRVVGVEGDVQYLLLGDDGEVMYVPQHWLWEGNG